MVAQGRWRRRWVVRRVPPARRGGGGRRERVPAGCVVPAPVPVEELPPIRRRRRHPRRRCGRRPSGAYPQLRRAPQITYARPSRLRSVAGLLSRSNNPRRRRRWAGPGSHRASVPGEGAPRGGSGNGAGKGRRPSRAAHRCGGGGGRCEP